MIGTTLFGNTHSVQISGDLSNVPLGSGFRLYDDDDFGLDAEPLPRQDLVNDQMKNYFKPSFVDVIDAAEFNSPDLVPLHLNEDVSENNPVTVVDDKRNLTDKKECWVCPITAAYQGSPFEGDHDGETNFDFGETVPHGNYAAESYYDHSTVFVETCREMYENETALRSFRPNKVTNARTALKKWITAIASHEMGHQPGNQEDDHPEGGLMAGDSEGIIHTSPESAEFSAKTVLRFRNANRWSK